MAIKTAPAAMIQVAAFEDMNFDPSLGRGKPRLTNHGYLLTVTGGT
jgi:hypothetical protein